MSKKSIDIHLKFEFMVGQKIETSVFKPKVEPSVPRP